MAVRFLPPPEERVPANRDENENLAEVVEMRSWLRPAAAEDAAHAEEPTSEAWAPTLGSWGSSSGNSAAPDASDDGDLSSGTSEAVTRDAGDPRDGSSVARVTRVRFGGPVGDSGGSAEVAAEVASPAKASRKRGAARAADHDSAWAAPVGTESGRSEAYEDGVRLLARRARSSGELRDDLLALDHSADDVSIVIDEFTESHYLDDLGLARVQSEKLRDSKGASRGQISRKLRERKLPDAVIEEILGELDVDEEFALLREAAAKRAERLTGLDRQTAQRRLLGFLARRGWSGEQAVRAANEALDGGLGRGSRGSGGVRFE